LPTEFLNVILHLDLVEVLTLHEKARRRSGEEKALPKGPLQLLYNLKVI